jgi:hypothetical protein
MMVGEVFSQISWQIVSYPNWWTWMIDLEQHNDGFTHGEG